MAGSGLYSRRRFITTAAMAGAGMALAGTPINAFAKRNAVKKITILHTNDVHSRIEPFAMDGSSKAGLGGFAQRANIINQIKKEENNILLLDAGDIWQGTPYFNKYGGELEFKLMSQMNYDAATLGNHDFDNGLQGLEKMLPKADFPFICSNYDFSQTGLQKKFTNYKVFVKDGIKVGIYGLGIELKGLVPDELYGNTIYIDALPVAQETEKILHEKENCDLVICLSHLGYKYATNKVSDEIIAQNTSFTDLIIGGHTHTFLEAPAVYKNKRDIDCLVNQMGWGGMYLGRIDFYFSANSGPKSTFFVPVKISEKSRG